MQDLSARATHSQPPAQRLPRLLVVDDCADNLWLMARLFDGQFEVLQATSGQQALALAAAEIPPDLVLLDILMPDMDGYEVLRRLRQHPLTAGIPVAFLTSLDTREDRNLGLDLGAVDYLTKPVDPQEVLRRVEVHARDRARARRLDALGERLSRHLLPQAWHQLFNGAGAGTIAFDACELTLLSVHAAALQGDAPARDAFVTRLDTLARRHGGSVDHYGWGHTTLFFDEPPHAMQAALALQLELADERVQLGLHHCACEVARFRGLGAWERTLLGDEASQARQATAGGMPGVIVVSPQAYALLREDLQAEPGAALVTEKFHGTGLNLAWLAPVAPARAALAVEPPRYP